MSIGQLELHYHLRDGVHSMNALVRNKSEAEALALFTYVAQRLGVPIELETSVYEEGGFRETLRFITDNKEVLALILAIVTLIFSRFPASDAETDALNKEILRLTIEEKKANLEKIKRELQKGPSPDQSKVSEAADALEGDLKVVTRRSNFYRILLTNERSLRLDSPQSPTQLSRHER